MRIADRVGERDFSFGAQGVGAPTGERPQSKLWWNDGSWWGSLFNPATDVYSLHRFDWATKQWADTGTVIDERNASHADILWDGTHLYVATAGPTSTNAAHAARILRYSYDPVTKRYALDPGFPIAISDSGMEAVVLDKDTTGKLWITYTQNSQVVVNRSLGDDLTWGTPFVPPIKGTTVTPDDISAVVAFDDRIGVLWSNMLVDAIYFAEHRDGDPDEVWQVSRTAIQGPKEANDHLNLKSLQADGAGRVFALVKTSHGNRRPPNSNAPLIRLLVRDAGNWSNAVFGRVGDNHTRPIVLLDAEHRQLYVFATSPCCKGGAIYDKQASLDNFTFARAGHTLHPERGGHTYQQHDLDQAGTQQRHRLARAGLRRHKQLLRP